mmetsp:Transcript_44760/g.142528  ORF Transcript_44760/g.142528 Transcript_44760/m.142528 type:complete len:201 (+) Transcript_44760:281-883(+)
MRTSRRPPRPACTTTTAAVRARGKRRGMPCPWTRSISSRPRTSGRSATPPRPTSCRRTASSARRAWGTRPPLPHARKCTWRGLIPAGSPSTSSRRGSSSAARRAWASPPRRTLWGSSTPWASRGSLRTHREPCSTTTLRPLATRPRRSWRWGSGTCTAWACPSRARRPCSTTSRPPSTSSAPPARPGASPWPSASAFHWT